MKKALLLAFIAIAFISTASALGTLEQPEEVNPGDKQEIILEITEGGQENVELLEFSSEHITLYPDTVEIFYESEDTIPFRLEAPETLNSKEYNISVVLEQDGDEPQQEEIVIEDSYEPYRNNIGNISVEEGYTFEVLDTVYSIESYSEEEINLTSLYSTECESFETLCTDERVSFEYIEDEEDSVLEIYTSEEEAGVEDLELNAVLQIEDAERGEEVTLEFLLDKYNETLTEFESENEHIDSGTLEVPLSYEEAELSFEADFEDNRVDTQEYTIELQDYEEFKDSIRPEITLQEEDLYENRQAYLEIDSEKDVIVNINGEDYEPGSTLFFTVPSEEELEVTAETQELGVESETIEESIVRDSTGDGVYDDEDECPEESGFPENEGCPPEEVSISVTDETGEDVNLNNLQPGEPYAFYFTSESTFEEEVQVENKDEGRISTVEVEGGSHEFVFEDEGTHQIRTEGFPQYESSEVNFEVEGSTNTWMIVIGTVLFTVSAVLAALIITGTEAEDIKKKLLQLAGKESRREEGSSQKPGRGEPRSDQARR